MSSENDSNVETIDDIAPVNRGSSAVENQLTEYTNLPDPFDELIMDMAHGRKEANKKHKTRDFLGVLLDYDEITISQCLTETHSGFVDLFGNTKLESTTNPDEVVCYRLKVYIPELESYLPSLSVANLTRYEIIKDQLLSNKTDGGEISEEDSRFYDFCRRRIHRFKTFYAIQDQSPTTRKGIKVKFIDDNFFYGIAESK